MAKNKDATRAYSDAHEKSVCKALGTRQQPNSGAGFWRKGDCCSDSSSLLVECKCSMVDKSSFSVKEEWLTKNEEEARLMRKENGVLCFNFRPDGKNYYVITEKLMKFLVEKLEEDYNG